MFISISFYILLFALVVFLNYKVFMLRRGKIELQTIHQDRDRKIKILKQIIKYFAHKLKDWLKEAFIKIAAWRIRAKARTNYFIETRLPWLYTLLQKRPEVEHKHAKNIFWRGVIEYKYKLQKLKAQIIEEENQKITEKINAKNETNLEIDLDTKNINPVQEIEQKTEIEPQKQNENIEEEEEIEPPAIIKTEQPKIKIEPIKITDKDVAKIKKSGKKRLFF